MCSFLLFFFFFFNDTATTEIYTLSLHDALPIYVGRVVVRVADPARASWYGEQGLRSEEHTSELQSHHDLVCRLLLEKKKIIETRCTSYNNITGKKSRLNRRILLQTKILLLQVAL